MDAGKTVEPGAVIAFFEHGVMCLGAILDAAPRARWRVCAEEGREVLIQGSQIAAVLDGTDREGALTQRRAIATYLAGVRARLDAMVESADAVALWDLVHEDAGVQPLALLSELMLGAGTDEARLATLMVLREARTHFQLRPEGVEPRPWYTVHDMVQVHEAHLQETQARAAAIVDLTGVLASPALDRGRMMQSLRGDSHIDAIVTLLSGYALAGDDYSMRHDAQEVLDALSTKGDVHFEGRRAARAFEALVALGLWSKDENLWLIRNQIVEAFSSDALTEAAHIATQPLPVEGRLDLTHLAALTIDAPETIDFDDALTVVALETGGWEVGIHIADATAFIPLGSVLDLEARARATSLYLPTHTIPMLPSVLSDDVLCLREGETRAALSFLVQVDEYYEVRNTRMALTHVRVARRMTFDEVDTLIETGSDADPWVGRLQTLYAVADLRLEARRSADAMVLDIPEIKVHVEPDGCMRISRYENTSYSRILVSEFMILANEVAGMQCAEHDAPVIYRGQERPETILSEDAYGGSERAWSHAQRRFLRPAYTTLSPSPHFCLGLRHYTQATSPLRRYTDILAHHQLKALMRGLSPPLARDTLAMWVHDLESTMGNAKATERQSDRYWLLRTLEGRRGERLSATVIEQLETRGLRYNVVLVETQLRTHISAPRALSPGERIWLEIEHVSARDNVLRMRFGEGP